MVAGEPVSTCILETFVECLPTSLHMLGPGSEMSRGSSHIRTWKERSDYSLCYGRKETLRLVRLERTSLMFSYKAVTPKIPRLSSFLKYSSVEHVIQKAKKKKREIINYNFYYHK